MSILAEYVARGTGWVNLADGTVTPRGGATGTVLFVTRDTPGALTVSEQVVVDRLELNGHTVVVRNETAVDDWTGIDLLVAGSLSDWVSGPSWRNPPVGVVALDSWRNFGMSTAIDWLAAQTDVAVASASHPLASGLSGTFPVYTAAHYLTWATDHTSDATLAVRHPTVSGSAVVFGYEAGDVMTDGSATTRHVGMGLHADGRAAGLTEDGWRLFDAAVDWALATAFVEAPPAPVVSGHFFHTDAQIVEYQTRMSGAGPFYSSGQGFAGAQANAPGDGERALTQANAFIADPTGDGHRYTVTVPLASGNPEPPVNAHVRPMRAAWCAMTLPGHANAATWRADAKAWLLWVSSHPNHDFSDSSDYPVNYPGWFPSPIFRISGWVKNALKTYDMLGRDEFTTGDQAALDRWFHGWANYILHHFKLEAEKGRTATSSTYGDGLTSYRAYDGGPYVGSFGIFTNRSMACIGSGFTIANYMKFHGVTPGTGGTQPSYGWWTVDTMLGFAKDMTEAWVKYSLNPDGFCYDFHRGQESGSPSQGWAYAANEIVHVLEAANNAERRGDSSLWNYATTSGRSNTSGSPNTVAGISGFPSKNLHYAQWMHSRYANDGWGRVLTAGGSTGPLAPSDAFRDVLNAAIAAQKYPLDTLLESSWKRVGNGFPGYPASPESQGQFSGWDGEMGTLVGLIEVGGV